MPLKTLKDIQVNTTTWPGTSIYGDCDVAGLKNGGFMVVWQSDDTALASSIRGRLIGADGKAVGTDFLVSTNAANNQALPAITELSNGKLVAVWSTYDKEYDIHAQLYNANGTASGGEFNLSSAIPQNHINPAVAPLAKGGFVTAWHAFVSAGTEWDVLARVFDGNGTAIGTDIVLNSTTAGGQDEIALTGLSTGGFAAAWQSIEGTQLAFRARAFDAHGIAAGKDFIVSTQPSSATDVPALTGLANGRFVVTWRSDEGGSNYLDIRGHVYDSHGKSVGKDFVVNSNRASSQYQPDVLALADGRFMACWTSYENDVSRVDIRARVFNANGMAAGRDWVINSTTSTDQIRPAMTLLANGHVAVSWESTDTAVSPAQNIHAAIRSTIIDPYTFIGTAAADKWTGGIRAEKLTGAGGHDTLTGGKGADQFIYNKPSEGGDTLTDFTKGDHFVFVGGAFGQGGTARFSSHAAEHDATGTKAQFIYDQHTDQLWFDANGSNAGGAVMIADLNGTAGFNLVAGDILIV
jgi:Ca2+-binding RTX toxin-like protein